MLQGVQSQERHLFLFSDLLLVAKARSGGNFKLKEKVGTRTRCTSYDLCSLEYFVTKIDYWYYLQKLSRYLPLKDIYLAVSIAWSEFI